MGFANPQVRKVTKVNNARSWAAMVPAMIECCGTRSARGSGAVLGKTLEAPEAQQRRAAQPLEGAGACGDWWVTAEHLADVAQSVVGIELTSAARAALVGMTVELLTLLTCWPTTARPAHALVYLRSRRARMGHHAAWFYDLPWPARWLLAGTDRVPSLLVFAVCLPVIDERSRQVWRKGLGALNELPKLAEDKAPEPSVPLTEPGQTSLHPCSDMSARSFAPATLDPRQVRHGALRSCAAIAVFGVPTPEPVSVLVPRGEKPEVS